MFDPLDYRNVAEWKVSNLRRLPQSESELYEYKSSIVGFEELKKKLGIAACAFWNSGGGLFVAGVDNSGIPDGGLPSSRFGKTSIHDWTDQVLSAVQPPGPYAVSPVRGTKRTKDINQGNVVLLVGFGQSCRAPHMAPDGRHYIRSGARSVIASSHMVELLRSSSRPSLDLRVDSRPHRYRANVILAIDLYLANGGGAPARLPGISISEPQDWSTSSFRPLTILNYFLRDSRPPTGWWKHLLGTSDSVIFPGQEHWLGSIAFSARLELQEQPPLEILVQDLCFGRRASRGFISPDSCTD